MPIDNNFYASATMINFTVLLHRGFQRHPLRSYLGSGDAISDIRLPVRNFKFSSSMEILIPTG